MKKTTTKKPEKKVKQPLALTEPQERVSAWARTFVGAHGRFPTLREIGAAFEIRSTNGPKCHLDALVKKGVIEKDGRSYKFIK